MNELKYVMFDDDEYLTFPKYVSHKDVSIKGRTPVSAGFVRVADELNPLRCHGKSTTLDLESRPDEDTHIMKTSLCI